MAKKIILILSLWSLAFSPQVARAENITVSVGSASAYRGESAVFVPINVNLTRPREIYGIDLSLTYEASLIKAVEVRRGNLVADWSLVANTNLPGEVKVALYHTSPLKAGQGELINILFDVQTDAQAGKKSILHLTKAEFAEASANRIQDGYVEILKSKSTYVLNITAAGGSVRVSPDKLNYEFAERVTLTALAHPGYHFLSWSGDLRGTDNPITITIESDKSVSANFELKLAEQAAAQDDTSAADAEPNKPRKVVVVPGAILVTQTSQEEAAANAEEREPSSEEAQYSPTKETKQPAEAEGDEKRGTLLPGDLRKEREKIPSSEAALREFKSTREKTAASQKAGFTPKTKYLSPLAQVRNERKELAGTPTLEAKEIKRFLIWRTYHLELKGQSQPFYWQLAEKQRLPFGLSLNNRKGTIYGIIFAKKRIDLKLIVTAQDRSRIEATCLLEVK